MIPEEPEENLPSAEEEGEEGGTEEGSRQNWDDRQEEMAERAREIALDAASGIEIALEATTPSQKGDDENGKMPSMETQEISDE